MIITYEFATGEVSKVEVDEQIGKFIQASRREEHALTVKEDYHSSYSIQDELYEGEELADDTSDPLSELLEKMDNEQLYAALEKLTPIQRKRLTLLADGLSEREIARQEGSFFRSVQDSINGARKKIKKFL